MGESGVVVLGSWLYLLLVDNQIVTTSNTIEHPPTPFKGGLSLMANPPLKGVGGCSMVFGISKK